MSTLSFGQGDIFSPKGQNIVKSMGQGSDDRSKNDCATEKNREKGMDASGAPAGAASGKILFKNSGKQWRADPFRIKS